MRISLIFLLVLAFTFSCNKQETLDPVNPNPNNPVNKNLPPTKFDLKYTFYGDNVELEWTYATDPEGSQVDYFVYINDKEVKLTSRFNFFIFSGLGFNQAIKGKVVAKDSQGNSTVVLFSGTTEVTQAYASVPDRNFESDLIDRKIDSNPVNDGKILISDARQVRGYNSSASQQIVYKITNLKGIESFANLNYLYIQYLDITNLDISNLTLLNTCRVVNNSKLTSLILPKNSPLEILYCNNNGLTNIDLSNFSNLIELNLSYNKLQKLDISKNPKLKFLDCALNDIKGTFDISNNSQLTFFYVSGNFGITNVIFSKGTSFKDIDIGYNKITKIDVTNYRSLLSLSISNNDISELDITKNDSLVTLFCQKTKIAKLDVTRNIGLTTLVTSSEYLKTICVNNIDRAKNSGWDVKDYSIFKICN